MEYRDIPTFVNHHQILANNAVYLSILTNHYGDMKKKLR